tara:strand:- start:58 stop:159 length:102 start_codon:yes stop_codon:yes gene_type:complete
VDLETMEHLTLVVAVVEATEMMLAVETVDQELL